MKTAISLPDELFTRAESLAEDLDLSRSELYRRALEEYLGRHEPDRVTEVLDELSEEIETRPDAFVRAAGERTLDRSDW